MQLRLHFINFGEDVNLSQTTARHIVIFPNVVFTKKGDPKVPTVLNCERDSHEVRNANSSVVLVLVVGECLSIRSSAVKNEWVRNHAVAGLEANLRLEGLRIDAAEHLEGNIWAVE